MNIVSKDTPILMQIYWPKGVSGESKIRVEYARTDANGRRITQLKSKDTIENILIALHVKLSDLSFHSQFAALPKNWNNGKPASNRASLLAWLGVILERESEHGGLSTNQTKKKPRTNVRGQGGLKKPK